MLFRKLFTSLLAISATLGVAASAPSFQIRPFTTEVGQSSILALAEDRNGYLWMGTRNGLCRYDGQLFRHFKSYAGDPCRLSSERINNIYISPNNYIWCITHDFRCYLFDPAREQFFDPLASVIAPNEEPPHAEWVYTLENGVTWIACQGAAYRIEEELLNKDFTGGGIIKYPIGAQGFAGTRVEKIRLDREGDEWLLTDQSAHTIGTAKQTPQRGRSYICTTDEGVYIAEHHGRLSYYAPQADRPHTLQMPASHGIVRNIQQIGRDTLGIATDRGLTIFYAAQERFRHIAIKGGDTNEFRRDRRGDLWIFTEATGVFRYDLRHDRLHHYATPSESMPAGETGSMYFWHEDPQGHILLTPHDGALGYYNPETDCIEPLLDQSNTPYRQITRRYCVDRQGNLWVAGQTGITRLTLLPHAFFHIELSSHDTKAFLHDRKGRIWVTSRDRTIRLFDDRQQLLGYLAPDGRLHREPVRFDAPIYCLHEDPDGTIWMGSRFGGLYRLRSVDERQFRIDNFRNDPKDAYSLSYDHIYDICRDRHGRLWIGSYDGGLNLVVEDRSERPRFLHGFNRLPYPLQAFAQVRTLEEVGDYLFVGTTSGLVVVSTDFDRPEEARCYTYHADPSRTDGLLSNDIRDIHRTRQGEVYLMAFSGGLSRIIPERSTPERLCCENLTGKEGLPSESVLAMVGEEAASCWIITEMGIFQFDPVERRFERFGTQYSSNDYFFSEAKPLFVGDRLLVGTQSGYCTLPAKPAVNHFVPPILLTELRINNEVHRGGIDHLRTLRLESDQRHLQLNFTALDYSNPEAIRYAYRFRRNNDEGVWLQLGSQHSLSLHDLDAGSFSVDIRSTNSNGVWVDNMITLRITVAPTFWESRWVWLLWGVLALVVVSILTVLLHLRAKVAMEQQLSESKLRFYTNLSHELRTPLTLITAPIDLLLRDEQLTAEGHGYLTVVRRNTQQLIHTINQQLDLRTLASNDQPDDRPIEDRPHDTELPATTEPSAPSTAEEPASSEQEQATRLRILIIEQNDELRTMIRNILRSEYTVYEAAESDEGLELALKRQPDLVISGTIMPSREGMELVSRLKSDLNTSHISILLLASEASLDDRTRGLELGVDGYIPMPFHASYLLARIRSLITRRQELQQRLIAQMATEEAAPSEPEEPVGSEERFLRQATAVVEAHLDDENWSIESFATELCISHTVLYQKLKAAVGLSPIEFIREVRLKRACQLIREGQHNIASISYMVGFSDPKYFTRVFKKRFGTPPSQYTKKE